MRYRETEMKPGLDLRAICREAGSNLDEIRARDKSDAALKYRRAVAWELVVIRRLTLPQVGRMLHRDHTSILSLIRYHAERTIGVPRTSSLADIRLALASKSGDPESGRLAA